ncbi:hypothetical protein HMPREF9318_00740 [Streptococcus urinalis FB127-CNA-2]|uniref:Inner membrane component domain-containing protein n=1 Tax=Streptococcus urinalis 2285-97 TaxID=764291 RepID=G5KHI5_9STRE|nr:YccF domain-containing protein [Streptococcus urinalis]EHJ55695.1 hypothetical protein STRUR_1501 [Streptococcus urinalis 2285-97]EKS22542.1 hypothetical protein HMPREF9318_00740 [Streptococcus urinalis FB127-CNA-2]VEF32355.1 Inner membrane protein yccF [Streptococcus urinalis]
MKILGNIIWFIFSGLWAWLAWSIIGLILCFTVIGIPVGIQCFKIGQFGLFPFGKTIEPGQSGGHLILNLIWIVLVGWELALMHLSSAILLCVTIVGIPFAWQSVKLAYVSIIPFGAKIVPI